MGMCIYTTPQPHRSCKLRILINHPNVKKPPQTPLDRQTRDHTLFMRVALGTTLHYTRSTQHILEHSSYPPFISLTDKATDPTHLAQLNNERKNTLRTFTKKTIPPLQERSAATNATYVPNAQTRLPRDPIHRLHCASDPDRRTKRPQTNSNQSNLLRCHHHPS